MTQSPLLHGRPLPAALGFGFAGTAFLCLLLRELLLIFNGQEAALGTALALLPLCILAGASLFGRKLGRRHPADLLAPLLGCMALLLPISLLLTRLARPLCGIDVGSALAWPTILGVALVALAPIGICLGCGLRGIAAVTSRHPTTAAAKIPLPAALAGAGCLGALFVQFVVIPKLSPLNATLDMGLGCAVAGLLCAGGAPEGRRMENWLSLLALAFVLALPISGVLDAKFQSWEWQCAMDAVPTAPDNARALLAATDDFTALSKALGITAALAALLALFGATGRLPALPKDTARTAAAAMAESTALLGILFFALPLTGSLHQHLPVLVAAFLAGETCGLLRPTTGATLTPAPAALLGSAIGFAAVVVLL